MSMAIDDDDEDMRKPQDQPGESHDGAYGDNDVYNTAEQWDQFEDTFVDRTTMLCVTTIRRSQCLDPGRIGCTCCSITVKPHVGHSKYVRAARNPMPTRSAAASAYDSDRKWLLCRGRHDAWDCPDRDKHNGKVKKGDANGKQVMALAKALAQTAARPNNVLSHWPWQRLLCGVFFR